MSEKKSCGSDKMSDRLNFYAEIKEALGIFDTINYSVISGGFVQNASKMGDVDIITVLPFKTIHTEDQILRFAEKHVTVQLKNNFCPDFHFPTDVVSRQQIIDATSGRALSVKDGTLLLKNYSDEEIASNPEADYRVWLYEMITHDFDLLGGNFDSLVEDTVRALRTIFLYTAKLYEYENEVSIEKLRSDLFLSAGLPYFLSEKQCRYLLVMLNETGFGLAKKTVRGDMILLNHSAISEQTKLLEKSVALESFFNSAHLICWNSIRIATEKYNHNRDLQ